MDLKIDINPEEVNKFVSEAVINSSLGATLKDSVQRIIKDEYRFKQSIDNAVASEVQRLLTIMLRAALELPENQAKIRQAISTKLTDDMLLTLTSNALSYMLQKTSS